MKSVKDLLEEGIKNTRLNILVFGPQVVPISTVERTKNLQLKRIQIREELEVLGHFVRYAEDLVDPNLPSPQNNAFLQEIVIMREYDLIFVVVDSPGSNVETGLIAGKPTLCQKASLFLDEQYKQGLSGQACEAAKFHGADYNNYVYPADLVDCNLLTFVKERVQRAQLVKLVS